LNAFHARLLAVAALLIGFCFAGYNGYPSRQLTVDEARDIISRLNIDRVAKRSFVAFEGTQPTPDDDGGMLPVDPYSVKKTDVTTYRATGRVAKPNYDSGWCFEVKVSDTYDVVDPVEAPCYRLRKSLITGQVFGLSDTWGADVNLNWQ